MIQKKDANYYKSTGKMLETALFLSEIRPVFPLASQGKTPITPHGFYDASQDPQVINSWWTENPNANIGLATGVNLIVLDIDESDGEATLDRLESN